jgi:hypothetical protein
MSFSFRLSAKPWRAALFAAVVIALSCGAATAQFAKYREGFEKAYDAGDYEGMKVVVSGDRMLAVLLGKVYEDDYCKAALAGQKDQAQKTLDAYAKLATIYKVEFKNDNLLANRRKWVETLDDAQKQVCIDSYKKYEEAFAANQTARAGDADAKKAVIPQLEETEKLLRAIKDFYYAAAAVDMQIECYKGLEDQFAEAFTIRRNLEHVVKPNDLEREYPNYESRLDELRKKEIKKPELIDLTLDVEAARAKYLKDYEDSLVIKAAPIDGKSGEVGTLTPPKTEDALEWEEHDGFKATKPVDPMSRHLAYVLQINPESPRHDIFWHIYEFKKGEKGEQNAPFLPGGAKVNTEKGFLVDVDGEGGKAREQEVKLKSKFEPQTFDIKYDDGTASKLTFLFQQYPNNPEAFGLRYKASDPEKFFRFYIAGASAIMGKCRGHTLMFIDSSINGAFDDPGEDTVIIDPGTKAERVEPFSRYVFLDQGSGAYPYEIKMVSKNGSKIRTKPFNSKTGQLVPLSLDYKSSIAPRFLIAKGSGEDESLYFNLMAAVKQPMWVPVSSYSIFRGYFAQGKDPKKEGQMVILKGRSGMFRTEPGKQGVWSLGGTGDKGFWMTTTIQRNAEDASTLEIVGKDLRVFGGAGEEYAGWYPQRILPTVEVRKGSPTGPILKSDKMALRTGDDIPMAELYFPATLQIKNVSKNDKIFVKLVGEHPMLGKIESEWLQEKE